MSFGLARRLDSWRVNVAVALTALRINLMRSVLTTLGVMIGVLAVTLAVAVGEGAKASVEESIGQLGSNMALVFPFPDSEGGRNTADPGSLTLRDSVAIERSVPGVTAVAPQLTANLDLTIPGRRATTSGIGTTPGYGTVSNIDAEEGRFLSARDVQAAARVILLGPTVATKLFGDESAVGQTVRVNRIPFSVIGVLQSKGSSFGRDNDDIAIVPFSTARQRFAAASVQGPDDLHLLFVGFDATADLDAAKRDISRVLRERNRVAKGDISPFTIRTTKEFQEETATVTAVFQAVLVAIASISLLVGGIGIMNIMLVSVTERTREIGLRMALGARRRDIRNQFLVEAATLCVIGGAIGLALAAAAAWAFSSYADFPAPVGLPVALGALIFSALVGLAFGGYPAVRASRLSPIEALRSE